MSPDNKNLQLVQIFRFIACILVALMLITVTFSETYPTSFLSDIFKFGGSGVDIFFVLSGFIITYSNRKYIGKSRTIVQFLKKRIIRIFPIYWIIISLFLSFQLLFPSFYRTHFQLSVANIFNTYLLLPNQTMVNGVSWSLTNELFFYILFTLALMIPLKKYTLLLLWLYLIFLLLLPVAFIHSNDNNNGFVGLLIFPMNIKFLLGVIIVLFIVQFPKKWCKPFIVTGIVGFIIAALFYNNGLFLFDNSYDRVLMFGLPSFLIIFSLVKYELVNNIIVNRLFLKLGDASYSIYLFHLPIVAAFFKIMVTLPVTNHFLLVLLSFLLLIIICFAGMLIYKRVESPLIKWLNKKLLYNLYRQ